MKEIILGFYEFLSFSNIIALIVGVSLGIIVGALPGLNSSMTLAILIPLTYKMNSTTAMILLFSEYVGAYYGGSISSILINTPGTAQAATTAFDGYPLAKQGKAMKAMLMALYGSVSGHFMGLLSLIFLTPPLSKIALSLSPVEITVLLAFALTFVSTLSGKSRMKGLISALLGVLASLIGLDPITGARRFTFGVLNLDAGISLGALLIGVFAMTQVFIQAKNVSVDEGEGHESILPPQSTLPEDNKITFREFIKYRMTIIRSSLVGIFVGVLPGIGGSTSAFLSYSIAKKYSKHPEAFGKGSLEGVCAPEVANNAVVASSLVPTFVLGIPGETNAAILLGALILHGLAPGPRFFIEQATRYYAIIIAFLFCSFALFYLGIIAIKMGKTISRIRISRLFPLVSILCIIGCFAGKNSLFDLKIMFIFALIGTLLRENGFPIAPLVISFILSADLEAAMRQSLIIGGGSFSIFFKRPISLLLIIVFTFFWVIQNIPQKKG